jgi:UDP-N-acetyl-D-glucosamine/UDP-N-acetyl-D-galactosamine dehydrogenase
VKKKIAVVGLGYVGLPLAVEFGKKFETIGFDINQGRVDELKNGYDRTLETTGEELKSSSGLHLSSNLADAKDCNVFIVTVPTPIDKNNHPDLTPIEKSTEALAQYLKKGDIVIYESTVYPGVTEEVCVPIIEKVSGLKFNEDFFCGYSPERINPGDKERTLTKILKITAGSTPEIATVVDELYQSIILAGTHKAPSIKVAEAAKVIENTQRDINIALMNELAIIFGNLGIDTHAVIDAAATKWNFINLRPGLVGGHCIGVDPYYLLSKAKESGYTPDLIVAAREINNGMGKHIADATLKSMIKSDVKIKDANILVMGVTFKENCPDLRNTKVTDIIDELAEFGTNVDVWDPWVDPKEHKTHYTHGVIAENPFEGSKKYDAFVVAVSHKQFLELNIEDYKKISNQEDPVLIDVKGVLNNPTWRL